ncbi:glycine zipper 2TM domain-containing protein [Parasphingorhabdus flavimaris]
MVPARPSADAGGARQPSFILQLVKPGYVIRKYLNGSFIMRNILMSIAAASLVLPAGAVLADPPAHAKAYGKYKNKKHKSRYDDRGRYYEPRRVSRDERIWRGDDGRYHCKRDNGTTGLIIGGAVGALVGREIDSRGDRTVGTLLGAAGGALLGREVDRSGMKCR